MEMLFRLRLASEVQELFDTTADAEDFDDVESESEQEDYVETQLDDESDEDVESDDDRRGTDEVAGERTSLPRISTQVVVKPPNKRHRGCQSYLQDKDDYRWSRNAPEQRDKRSRTNHIGAPKDPCQNVRTPLEAWSLFFDDEILSCILTRTNEEVDREIAKMIAGNITRKSHHKRVEMLELRATIGLLYFAGLLKVNNTDIQDLWSPFSSSIFRMTISQHRFKFILSCMRFDDKNTREERKANDRLAHIREIWDKFIANCMANYEPHSNCTIDKQLLSFRGKCLFRTYLPTKSDRYGLKILTLNDATTHYLFNAIPYCGVINDKDQAESVPSYYVRRLSEPIYNTGRNVTCNSWFTSVPICQKMLEEHNITMVGTLHKNKQEIPAEFKTKPTDGAKAQFAYRDGKVLVSYNPKSNKNVLLLSSYHTNGKIDEATGKPEIVLFYNDTKGGTNSFDKKCRDFTTTRKTRRWPMRYFYGMLDQANVNSFIIYSLLKDNEKIYRKDYIRNLSMALVKPFLAHRLTCSTLRTVLRVQIKSFLDHEDIPEDQDPLFISDLLVDNKMPKQKRCKLCPSALDRKTLYKCLRCENPMCKEHTAKICCECSIQMSSN